MPPFKQHKTNQPINLNFNKTFIKVKLYVLLDIKQTCRYEGFHRPSMISGSFLDQRPQPFHCPQTICTRSRTRASHLVFASSLARCEISSVNRLHVHQITPTCTQILVKGDLCEKNVPYKRMKSSKIFFQSRKSH